MEGEGAVAVGLGWSGDGFFGVSDYAMVLGRLVGTRVLGVMPAMVFGNVKTWSSDFLLGLSSIRRTVPE